jgi:hypothetical protein
MSALTDIHDERDRQIRALGYSAAHDDEHNDGSLALAAMAYAYASTNPSKSGNGWWRRKWVSGKYAFTPRFWPWSHESFKSRSQRGDLVRAGAMIVAEIERFDRKASK